MPTIDPTSPVPLYHQIALQLRARIESGQLGPGDVLEPLRAAAADWQVNFHTVRHAYAELARDGLIEMRRPRGTRVLGPGTRPTRSAALVVPQGGPQASRTGPSLEAFLTNTLLQARRDFGLSAYDLGERLLGASDAPSKPRISVIECSDHQCQDLARQIESAWVVDAVPWCLEREAPLPACDVIATHFHYNEIRLRWPDRLASTIFVSIAPDPAIEPSIERRLGKKKNASLVLCERDTPTAEAVAADLSVLLPPHDYPLRIEVLPDTAASTLESIDGDLLLLPPRLWGALTPAQRNSERLLEVRYLYDSRQLEETAVKLGWTTARSAA